MKRNLLLLLICFMGSTMYAQFTLDHPEVSTEALTSEDDVSAHSRLHNTTTANQTYIWTRDEVVMAEGWSSAVCDTNQCYLPFVNTQEFEMKGGETSEIIMHVYPDGNAGEGEIKVTLEQMGNTAETKDITFYFTIAFPTSIDSPENFSVSVFPNPTNDYIMLSENSAVHELTIYNILGRPLRKFLTDDGLRYDISDLATGMYLARLTDEKGKTLKTLRVSKR